MKTIEQIKEHLRSTIYTHNARTAIRYWLIGRGIINEETEIQYRDHSWVNGVKTEAATFEDFKRWFDLTEINAFIDDLVSEFTRMAEEHRVDITLGDYVKVLDNDNPRDEYVIFIGKDAEGKDCYGLSDGTWQRECFLVKYAVQGKKRMELRLELNKIV